MLAVHVYIVLNGGPSYRNMPRRSGQGTLQDSHASRGVRAHVPGHVHRVVREICAKHQGL